MMRVRAAGDRVPPQRRVLSASTRLGMPALLAQVVVIQGPRSSTMAPPPLLKLLRPLVLLLPLGPVRRPPSMKFIWNIVVVSEVNWNSGVVSPAVASVPG